METTVKHFLVDAITLKAMLLDAIGTFNAIGHLLTEEDIARDVINEHLERGEIKEL